ncbi:glycosyltransferase [Pseudodesulfovibrio sp.]|uniref:glycosyltransferase family protein n=1 Tax=Pseudodesulfovibrio sp. TaxID=2035812 RepID=UPI00262389A4|nr:glycosyltransferase [Pseudodesulfovibrio sp.]MDD3312590.1 glycosyltransferase [Pseudodesulfovibrio sp.]
MRILNLDGRYFVEPFRRMGHEVLWIGPFAECDVPLDTMLPLSELLAVLRARAFTPDLVVWADICRPPSVVGVETLPAVTVGFSIDQYCNPWHLAYGAAFDLMLVAQKDYLPLFAQEQLGNELEWFPLFCDAFRDADTGEERDIPVSFVGTVAGSFNRKRKAFLDAFRRGHPLFATQGDYAPVYNRSRLVLNQSAAGELNFRIFEALGCGAAVLTEEAENGLSELFADGEDLLLYPRGDSAAAADMARRALADGSAERTAKNGWRKVHASHSSAVRARRILKRAGELLATGPTWRRRNPDVAARRVANAYNILASDAELALTPELRAAFARLARATREAAAK